MINVELLAEHLEALYTPFAFRAAKLTSEALLDALDGAQSPDSAISFTLDPSVSILTIHIACSAATAPVVNDAVNTIRHEIPYFSIEVKFKAMTLANLGMYAWALTTDKAGELVDALPNYANHDMYCDDEDDGFGDFNFDNDQLRMYELGDYKLNIGATVPKVKEPYVAKPIVNILEPTYEHHIALTDSRILEDQIIK